jgi:hypothetical protein
MWGGAKKVEGKMEEWTGKCGEGPESRGKDEGVDRKV